MQLKACLQERTKNLQYLGTNFRANMRSFYIGKATDATSSCFLHQCMKKRHYAAKFITVTHGSDMDNLSQSAMLSHRHCSKIPTIRHVFGDFTADGRVDKQAYQVITHMAMAADKVESKESKEEIYQTLWRTMCDYGSVFFSDKAWCYRHL